MDFTTAELCFLRYLNTRPFEECLAPRIAAACGLDEAGVGRLKEAGLAATVGYELRLTDEGRKTYRKAAKGRYF